MGKIKEYKMKQANLSSVKKKKLFFYFSIIILPLIQFFVFYIIVNANTFVLALKNYTYSESGLLISQFVGFKNIGQVFKDFFVEPVFQASMRNSFIAYFVGLVFGTAVSLLFSYYIFKKRFLFGTFKVLLYLPNIVSVMVLSIMYKFLMDRGAPVILDKIHPESEAMGLLQNPDTRFLMVMVFSVLVGFGVNVLLYSGTMSSISPSVLEAAEVDGVNDFQEFFHIVLPQVYPTLVTFLVAQLATVFTNQINLFNFYGVQAENDMYTFGYYMYRNIQVNEGDLTQYPYLAAIGLALTIVALPITLGIRKLLNKIGPSND